MKTEFNIRLPIGSKQLMTLMRNLSVTLKAGVSLSKALKLFAANARGTQKAVISHLQKTVESGHMLSEGMRSSPYTFPALAVNLVKTGEIGGTLEESLEQVGEYIRKSVALKRKVRSAMMYPTFVFVAVFGLGLSIGTFVLPELIPLFDSLDVELPWTTRLLLVGAEYFDAHGASTAIGCVIAAVMAWGITRLEFAKLPLHQLMLFVPYIREVQQKTAIAQTAQTLSMLLRSGIPIHEALPATAESVSNRVFRKAIAAAIPVVESGHPLHVGLRRSSVFTQMSLALIEIGEETGTLSESLEYLAGFYEEETDYAVKNLTTALEPMLLILIGLVVGGTVLAIITPIYDVTSNIR